MIADVGGSTRPGVWAGLEGCPYTRVGYDGAGNPAGPRSIYKEPHVSCQHRIRASWT